MPSPHPNISSYRRRARALRRFESPLRRCEPLSHAHCPGSYRIGVWRDGTGIAERGIMRATRSRFYHVALITPGNEIIEATWPRVRAGVWLDLGDPNVDLFVFRPGTGVDRSAWQHVEARARFHIGDHYDTGSIVAHLFKFRHRNERRWTCSEFVFKIFREERIRLLERIDPEYVTPYHIVTSPLLVQLNPTPA